MDDNVVFLTQKVINLFFIASSKQEMRKSLFRKTANENKRFKRNTNYGYAFHTRSDKAFNDSVINRTLSSLHGGSL